MVAQGVSVVILPGILRLPEGKTSEWPAGGGGRLELAQPITLAGEKSKSNFY